MPSYRISINGRLERIAAEPGTPLLWILRDSLGLRGTKYGCGVGLCGACLVHLDGDAARSCMIPIESVGSSAVTTIEGLTGTVADTLTRAWVSGRVPQCGYCQTGQIMRAAALLNRENSPSHEAIRAAISENLCRCGTYGRVIRAVERVARDIAGT